MERLTDEQERKIVDGMRNLIYEHEPETPEEIDAFLRSEGLDPEALVRRGRELLLDFMRQRDLLIDEMVYHDAEDAATGLEQLRADNARLAAKNAALRERAERAEMCNASIVAQLEALCESVRSQAYQRAYEYYASHGEMAE